MLNQIKVIFWDFDGVILESNSVREKGFREVLKNYPSQQVEELLSYHRENGGLSRYVKFRHFFKEIRKENYREEQITQLAYEFSQIMRELLIQKENLITETVDFIKNNFTQFQMHIVSGSDQEELRYLCKKLEIDTFFKGIYGSPIHKNDLVKNLLDTFKYNPLSCVLIGDSINDSEAAEINKISFKAYNNNALNHLTNIDFKI
jgi:phosphoglycolate phosphatase-like HAD superfamily hydrolase